MKAKITAAVFYLASGALFLWLELSLESYYWPPYARVWVGTGLFVAAAAGVFWRPRLSYCLGLLSGLAALYWFWQIEFEGFPALNCWIQFNMSPDTPGNSEAKLRILFAVIVVTSTACSVTRLLPSRWALSQKTWPALALCFVAIATWYLASVSPYRMPLIVDGMEPDLTMLHVEKHGMQFREKAIAVYGYRPAIISRNDRRLFHYQFAEHYEYVALSDEMIARALSLAKSAQLKDSRTAPAVALRNWNAEGWYVRIGSHFLAYTTEYGTKPPPEIVSLFRDMESSSPAVRERGEWNRQDICMGFCYDPIAGLGFDTTGARCRHGSGHSFCK